MSRQLLIAGLLALGLVSFSGADEPKKEAKDAKDQKDLTLESKIEDSEVCPSCAGRFDYAKDFGMELDSLRTLSRRIAMARRAPDPVDLIQCAQILASAEKVSGKKSKVTSEKLTKDAIELAKVRGISAEMKLVAALVPGAADDLKKSITAAQTLEKDEKLKVDTNEVGRSIEGTLQVINHSGECLNIYVDGHYVGEVHMGQARNFHVHAHGFENVLEAICESGHLVSHRHVQGHNHFVSWHIH